MVEKEAEEKSCPIASMCQGPEEGGAETNTIDPGPCKAKGELNEFEEESGTMSAPYLDITCHGHGHKVHLQACIYNRTEGGYECVEKYYRNLPSYTVLNLNLNLNLYRFECEPGDYYQIRFGFREGNGHWMFGEGEEENCVNSVGVRAVEGIGLGVPSN